MSDGFEQRLRRRFGDGVQTWLVGLPALLDRLAARWGLELGQVFPDGNSAVTLRAVRGGVPVVLKVSPEVEFAAEQADVLRAFAPSGRVPEVLASADGALLLEHIDGRVGWPTPDRFAALLRDLHSAVPDPTRHARRDLTTGSRELAERFPPTGPVTAAHLDRGWALMDELAATQRAHVLLHGDLHRDNLLDAGPRGLVVIDPKAILGEPEWDAIDYVLGADDIPARLTALLDESTLDPDRLEAWCRALAPPVAIGRHRTGNPIDHLLDWMTVTR
ncbi:phosphotransferase [Actinokineospora auranticolor]|uniref:Streptomycin 6-kinase n=1 Tax=Actinokineospora auranticolor TaxID=155976 RepID=A0A2S6GG36_9PSEU|nr:aminoglycoside phosphotransferase family protein [Actinokineospora auranticolor]PPK64170.1 streptomycin 6-kinase [Actinokineospora auranticolor]